MVLALPVSQKIRPFLQNESRSRFGFWRLEFYWNLVFVAWNFALQISYFVSGVSKFPPFLQNESCPRFVFRLSCFGLV